MQKAIPTHHTHYFFSYFHNSEKQSFRLILASVLLVIGYIAISPTLTRYVMPQTVQILTVILEILIITVCLFIALMGWMIFPRIMTRQRLIMGGIFLSAGIMYTLHFVTSHLYSIPFDNRTIWYSLIATASEAIFLLNIFLSPDRKVTEKTKYLVYMCSLLYAMLSYLWLVYFYKESINDSTSGLGVVTTTLILIVAFRISTIIVLGIRFRKSNKAAYYSWLLPILLLTISDVLYALSYITNFTIVVSDLYKVGGYYFLLKGIYTNDIEKSQKQQKRVERKLRQKQRKVEFMAFHDELTKLANRRFFFENLDSLIKEKAKAGQQIAVFFLDMDRFKYINDSLGHSYGDAFLVEVANRLSSVSNKENVARMGGDEFTILIPFEEDAQIDSIAQQILVLFEKPFLLHNQEFYITSSIGISIFPHHGNNSETLVQNADIAMYQSKKEGTPFEIFNPNMINSTGSSFLVLESDLRKALEREELELYYQPQIELESEQIIGAEALIRWNHPEKGLISPGEFIPVAEETGLIIPIGEWVLRKACAQNKELQHKGFPPIRIAVNLSAKQFKQPNLVSMIKSILQETGLDPQYLELEITESIAMLNIKWVLETLHKLREMGIHISIDDFGAGYSSLSYLKNFPINGLKIDRSFIKDIMSNKGDEAIANTIIHLANHLKINVIAEGVEHREQLDRLETQSLVVQGYLFSKPLPLDRFKTYLHQKNIMK